MRRVEVLDGTIVYNGKSYSKGDVLEMDTKIAKSISHLLKDVKDPVVEAPEPDPVVEVETEVETDEQDKDPVVEAPEPSFNPFASNKKKNKSKGKKR